ncbi:hypothetical protein FSP39_017127 [Pinctada imbricata]|uniref:Uncharacterized protein n=1 Tax=Pinctada imbricata TaxID=66713 RepID=A0AA88XZT0_PINIB|nr:hypothetical protein FSP39_017127 [Pinctada imbricata]
MDDNQRKVISVHRNFLMNNIIWTDSMEQKLRSEGLITDSTSREIKLAQGNSAKIGLLLDGLALRQVMKAYGKWCDVLQACGHAFIADFLRDAEHAPEKFDTKEVYQKLHFLERLKDNEKLELERFFVNKFRDESLKRVWRDDVRDKEKAVESKRQLIEMYSDHKDETKKWMMTKDDMNQKLQESREEILSLKATISGLKHKLAETEDKQKVAFDAQLKYTQANENQYHRMKERLKVTEDLMTDIQDKICAAIKSRPRKARNPKEEVILEQNKYAFAMEDLDRLLEKHDELKDIGHKYFDLCDQRDYILAHMGYETGTQDAISLLDAYKDFAVKSEETMSEMREKLEMYGDMVETHKKQIEANEKKKNAFQMGAGVWQAAILNVMRNQLQDTKKELRMKESRLQMTEQENRKMKASMRELEAEIGKLRRSKSVQRQSRELLTVDLLPSNASDRSTSSVDDLSDRDDGRRNKAPMLPPLHLQPQVSYSNPSNTSPRKPAKTRQLGFVQNRYFDLPEGLSTAPVKLENRHKNHQGVPGLGDLKAMNARSKFEKSLNPAKVQF